MSLYARLNNQSIVTNLSIFIDLMARQQQNILTDKNALIIQAGIKTHLFNHYYDF